MAASGALAIEPAEMAIARLLATIVAEADRRRQVRGLPATPARFRLTELRGRLLRERIFEDPGRFLARLRRRGLLEEIPEGRSDRVYVVPFPDALREAIRAGIGPSDGSTEPEPFAPNEPAEIHAMDGEFLAALREVLTDRLEETIAFGRGFSVARLEAYLAGLFGEALAVDSLIALVQQYALADVPLVAPTGRTTGTTGFHLALFGPPGTGKTFSIDDMIRGNPRSGVPAHGLPGRNRYCGGITPVQFLRVGAAYTGRTFNFIVPEFNDWF
ncbi:MAG TPA: hypothetical protein VLX64_04365, partial [Thermoplasmata archaeon]|nr:hypothetical protein [Thermoplasmata archaeon]